MNRPRCIKCHGNSFKIEWLTRIEPRYEEWLQCECLTCGYPFNTKTKDNLESENDDGESED